MMKMMVMVVAVVAVAVAVAVVVVVASRRVVWAAGGSSLRAPSGSSRFVN